MSYKLYYHTGLDKIRAKITDNINQYFLDYEFILIYRNVSISAIGITIRANVTDNLSFCRTELVKSKKDHGIRP